MMKNSFEFLHHTLLPGSNVKSFLTSRGKQQQWHHQEASKFFFSNYHEYLQYLWTDYFETMHNYL